MERSKKDTMSKDMEPAKLLLSQLKERIEAQLAAEYHSDERQVEEYENLTVPRFLEMLVYMFRD